jgi:aquaporin related protein
VYWTGGSLNPARSLAPCIVNNEFTSYHWIYWVGPIAGTILAVLIFKLVKALEYETLTKEEKQELLPRPNAGKRRASSTIPLASIHSVEMEPTRAPQAPRKPMQKEVMEEGQNLPTCLAD